MSWASSRFLPELESKAKLTLKVHLENELHLRKPSFSLAWLEIA